MKNVFSALVAVAATGVWAAFPEIAEDTVSVRQNGGKVTIAYALSGEAAIVTAEVLTNGAPIAACDLTGMAGDVNRLVSVGNRAIVWRPYKTAALRGLGFAHGEVSVKLTVHTQARPPLYMCADLLGGDVTYYVSSNAIPNGVQDDVYRKTKMLFRRIDAANVLWRMGGCENFYPEVLELARPHPVTLTHDYYMAVYPITHAQYRALKNADVGYADFKSLADWSMLPAESLSYNQMRGDGATYEFQTGGYDAIDPNSVIGVLRARTGGALKFDLPTEAEWEFAAGAGTVYVYSYGKDPVIKSDWTAIDETPTKALIGDYCWFNGNATDVQLGMTVPHKVGTKPPNPWGLYDMYGNVWEGCHDYLVDNTKTGAKNSDGSYAVDPIGPVRTDANVRWTNNRPLRVMKGGSFDDSYKKQRHDTAHDNLQAENGNSRWCGFRLICPIAVGDHTAVAGAQPAIRYDEVTREALVTYTLAGTEPKIVTVDIKTNGCSIGAANFADLGGDVNRLVQPGTCQVYWRPDHTWAGHRLDTSKVSLTVDIHEWTTNNPPNYVVADLSGTGLPLFYYESEEALPGGIASDVYKMHKLVMRKIPAANKIWTMGWRKELGNYDSLWKCPDTHLVQLTKDYWMGVYQITDRQYFLVYRYCSSQYRDTHPRHWMTSVNNVPWDASGTIGLRGSGTSWPGSHAVASGSFFDRFRKLVPALQADLPTESQWEFAFRAETETLTPWGNDVTQAASDPYAWNTGNWDKDPELTGKMHHVVGLLKPNAFGIYDMGGNVWEWCLDYFCEKNADRTVPIMVDPAGPSSSDEDAGGNAQRVIRGGSFDDSFKKIVISARSGLRSDCHDQWRGVRIVAPIVPEDL